MPLISVILFDVRYSSCRAVQGSRFSTTDILFSVSHNFFSRGQPCKPSIFSILYRNSSISVFVPGITR
jgi:hypothetical protein